MDYTLFELNSMVRSTIDIYLNDEYWVEAELSETHTAAGHCYMELVQKDDTSNTPIARASAKCWRNTWQMVRPHFESTTGMPLMAGMKVRMKVYPQFHENYGFSWIVKDIDPTFTIGEMQRRRQEIIRKLQEWGIFDLNKELELSPFAQRIAVISSENAAGYGDFCNQLSSNLYGFEFNVTLFEAIMQGERVEESVIAALNAINHDVENYDCVVIIRGGGATSDLSGFDTLQLAENVANFPLPIITGIGHDRDESVIDMIAHTRVKTPTAAAVFLIDNLKQTDGRIDVARNKIINLTSMLMEREQLKLARIAERMPSLVAYMKLKNENKLDTLSNRLKLAASHSITVESNRMDSLHNRLLAASRLRLTRERNKLELLEQRAAALDPKIMLKRGYSITIINGHALRDPAEAAKGDIVETIIEKGKVRSEII